MPALKLEQFGGQLPAWDQRLLPPGQAARSLNGYLFSGALKGWRKPKVLRTLSNANARMAFRLPSLEERQAKAYLVFLAQPNDGDALIIGDNGYVFKLLAITDQDVPGVVKIGDTITDTVTNLIAAITADGGTNDNAGVLYSENTIANNDVKWYRVDQDVAENLPGPGYATVNIGGNNYTFLQVGSPDFGAAFNETEVLESTGGVRMTWLRDLLDFADTTTTFHGGVNASFDNNLTGSSYWLEFNDADTNVLKSSVVDDRWQRYYTASPSQPPKYNPYDRILDGLPFWLLGVPAPGCAPIASVTGGGNNLTLGRPDSGGGEFVGPGNAIFLIPIHTPGATTIQDIKFVASPNQSFQPTDSFFTAFDGDVADGHFVGVVYQDDGTHMPGDLLATGQVVTGISATNENIAPFTNPVGLEGDTDYWIGIMIDVPFKYAATFGSITEQVGWFTPFTNGPSGSAPTNVRASVAGDWPDTTTDQDIVTGLFTINMWGDFITSDVIEARSYVYTWVSAYNEEGPPSPASLLNGWSNGTWTLGLWTPPDNDRGVLRNLTGINIYRTVVGSGGQATFFKVANVPIGTATFQDTTPDSTVALNEELPSTNWFPPPENLQGLIAMPNGVMAGFANNQIWFCDPYHPHAWPPGFVLTTEFPIVGLGLTNGALVACTATVPYVVSGQSPGTMTLTKCGRANPCSSRGSIVSGDDFVTYHSPNGLIQVSPSGVATNTTDLWFTREQWKALTPGNYLRAVYHASCYFAYGSTSPATVSPADNSLAQDGFTIELDQDNQSFTIWPQPGGHRLGFNELDSHTGEDIDNVLTDPWTGICLLISDGKVWYYDFADRAPDLTTYTWKSKIYQQNNKKSYEAMKVFFTIPSTHAALNAYRIELPPANSEWLVLGSDRYGYIKTYADFDGTGQLTLIDCREIRKPGELLRIVSGFKAEQWQWEIVANVEISSVQIATSAKELASV
jgi:hypothetical protein